MNTSLALRTDRNELLSAFRRVRKTTESLCAPLESEDMVVQSMPDVSPTKWHLAHVSWFFETFVLVPGASQYRIFDERYHELFNSYYQALGSPYPRAKRGVLSRPTVSEVFAYRRHVDTAMEDFLMEASEEVLEERRHVLTVGLHHEQQHQELLLMDIKHVLAQNPLHPAYSARSAGIATRALPHRWLSFSGGQVAVGATTDQFTFDNERPQHVVTLAPFELASRAVDCGDFRNFIEDGGYRRPELWLSDGWDLVQRRSWSAPLYWLRDSESWKIQTLGGVRALEANEPVCHLSYFEADAYATWAGARLPTEHEWEHAMRELPTCGNFLDSGRLHPSPATADSDASLPLQAFGDVWEWTCSPYSAYPGYEPFAGDLGEYNGKFMINQLVLRGGSCVTPRDHMRLTYRNFFYPQQRWMFSGLRLARTPR